MAELGAHLTSTTVSNRPSFFEVLAQESLMSTLRPAMKHLIKILAEHNPARYAILYRFADEIYTSVDVLLQHHFLSTTSASFAENFYSLKRVCAAASGIKAQSDVPQGLRSWQHLRSIIFLALVPYLKLKLEALYERWRDEDLDRPGAVVEQLRLRRIFKTVFPFLHMTLESTMFFYQLRYLFDKSDCHSPFLKLAGVRLKNLSREDILFQASQGSVVGQNTGLSSGLWHYLKRGIGIAAISISQGLSVSIFFLQFLEWWYMSQDNQSRLAVTALPIPKPPKVEQKEKSAVPEDVSLCPLCHKHRTNDTALSTSGYVFCYPCIYSFLKGHHCCPVTSYPSKLSHLVKLYPPDS
ncbi:peroxisome assembly protein 12-like [Asterias rubens]|uniref:peroxisome assembly protein 12-like n=1 Tax=Asterias rubens TaxID=7604 RepID=UPI001455D4B3|nr:peroxisome assembly protein 12-like [Asterias rubens]